MKLKFLLILVGEIILFGNAVNAHEVPTEVQKKNILLEVFTGIHCGNCPDGDVITDNFLTAQPFIVYAMDIHANYYAVPNAGEPDYRTDEGEWIDAELEAGKYGYPGGAINRHEYPTVDDGESPYVFSRSKWIKAGKEMNAEDAPINLLLKSVFDGSSRELKITIEGYYTADVEDAFHLLNIAITQDNILGPQSGSNLGNNYNHRHALRAYVTPMWGDTILLPQKGEYFSKEYIYELPTAIRSVPVHAEEIEVIAFVAVDKTEVLNVTGKKPEYVNYSKSLAATLQQPKPPMTTRYACNFFPVILKNESSDTITTAGFRVQVNDEVQEVNREGIILPFHTEPIQITVDPYTMEPRDNTYTIRLLSLNNATVSQSSISGTFSAPIATTPTIFLEIKTDLYADENRYFIKDADGSVVQEFGPYPSGISETYKETSSLEPNKIYCFEVIDFWGDGVGTLPEPRGSYKLYNDNRSLIAQLYDIKTFGDKVFIQTTLEPTTAITSVKALSKANVSVNYAQRTMELQFLPETSGITGISIYSLDGKQVLIRTEKVTIGEIYDITIPVSSLPKGVYLLNIKQQGKTETIKLIL
jgi:hypothetical protein